MTSHSAFQTIRERFVSGNAIPVERTRIDFNLYESLKEEIADALSKQPASVDCADSRAKAFEVLNAIASRFSEERPLQDAYMTRKEKEALLLIKGLSGYREAPLQSIAQSLSLICKKNVENR